MIHVTSKHTKKGWKGLERDRGDDRDELSKDGW